MPRTIPPSQNFELFSRKTFSFKNYKNGAQPSTGGSSNACNGYPSLCSKSYQEVSYATAHNAFAVGKYVAANQNFDLTIQLKDGVRAFMFDAHEPINGTDLQAIELCHQSCKLLDMGNLVKTLEKILDWLNSNPNEVITILWENFDKIAPARFQNAYQQAGLLPYLYTRQDPKQPWPTLQSIINSGKRVVNFIDTGADANVPWLMSEYDYVFETPFENFDANGFKCTVDRPKDQPRSMYVLNHFLYGKLPAALNNNGQPIDIPQSGSASQTNSQNLQNHADNCKSTFGKIANFVAIDFYDKGENNVNALSVVANLNGVQYIPKPLGTNSTKSSNNPGKGGITNFFSGAHDLRVSRESLLTILAIWVFKLFFKQDL
ncbi:hypothetical protein G9A89_012328 [Geosiphon pyriformis]|nr:hypothetical protein G9A89_012328 [Geosiphon pyriformis]